MKKQKNVKSKKTTTMPSRSLSEPQCKLIQSMIEANIEERYLDFPDNGRAASNAAVIVSPPALTQGDAQGQRDGDHIQWSRAELNVNFTGSDNTNVIRFIIFQWRVNSFLSTPTTGTILSLGPTGAVDILSLHNYATRKNYHILHDEAVTLCLNGSNNVVQKHILLARSKFLPEKVEFNPGVSSGINLVYCLVVSDSLAVAHPIQNLNLRLWYRDA